jgi:RNA polymerase sigma-70 factor (ECF subfamily)
MQDRQQRWIDGVRNGDEEAFEAMFRAYYPQLRRFAAEYVGTDGRARDVVQDIFLRIWEKGDEWTIRRSLKSYLFQAVRNRALNEIRHRGTKEEAEDELAYEREGTDGRTALDDVHESALSKEVQAAIDDLPERRRMAFLLHRRHGFTYKEVACIMDITPKTVENQIGRALKSLREALSPIFSRKIQ